MTTPPPQPTLLVFTLGAAAETRRRALLGPAAAGRGDERDLRRACFEAVVASGRETGCRVVVSCPAEPSMSLPWLPQRGTGFGERLAGAMEKIEAEPAAGPTVVVGTDTPELGAGEISRALELLGDTPESSRRAVLGPSPDGGIYLLAASEPVAHLLPEVTWCRRSTRRRLAAALKRAGFEVVELAPLADLDRPSDLTRLLARSTRTGDRRLGVAFARLIERLLDLLADLLRPPVAPPERAPVPVPVRPTRGRSPPRRRRRH